MGYLEIKQQAKKVYSKIGRVSCPALGDEEISFTRVGFDHLIRKGRVKRNKKEQFHRFRLIKYARRIVQSKDSVVLYRENKEDESVAHFWTLVKNIRGVKVKLVIRQINDGSKHFFSIMGDRNKKSPK